MFEAFKIIKTIKKLVNDSGSIPGSLVTETEHLVKQKLYSIDEVAVMVVQVALRSNYISRDNLTPRGETLISEAEIVESNLE